MECSLCFRVFLRLFILLGSFALLVLSIWTLVQYETHENLIGSASNILENAAFCGTTAGVVGLVTALWSLFGVKQERKAVIQVMLAGVVITICLSATVAVLSVLFLGKFDVHYGEHAITALKNNYKCTATTSVTITSAWDEFQRTYECCGFFNGSDYQYSYFHNTTLQVQPWPLSCCALATSGGYVSPLSCVHSATINGTVTHGSTGCRERLFSLLSAYATQMGATSCVLLALLLLLLVTSLTTLRRLQRQPKHVKEDHPPVVHFERTNPGDGNIYTMTTAA